MQTQPHAEQSDKQDFGATSAANTIRALWNKVEGNLTTSELEWFSRLSDEAVVTEMLNLECAMSALGLTINSDDSSGAFEDKGNVASLLFSLSNQIGVIRELAIISSDADCRLRHPDLYSVKPDKTSEQATDAAKAGAA
ncbi:hypothetical protein [Methylomonas sp. DH-1]|uniref:hypothetical protein n=1 Tax=Methylomonas sp. (strain DH-1) TaxID=1727196 RepID=UPI0012F63EDF|nr:hypothetical protein [Methylomonas sp. DH-1]